MTEAWLGPRALASLTGVSTDTLRHYERLGLLPGTRRSAAGYRRYPMQTAERVLVIQRSLVVGFTLKDLAQVLAQRDRGSAPCRGVRALVGDRLSDLDRRIEELIELRAELRTLVADWDARLAATPDGHRARLLDMLADRPAIEHRRLKRPARPERRK